MYWCLWEDASTNLQGPMSILEDQVDDWLVLYPDSIIFEADLVPPTEPLSTEDVQEFLRVVQKYKDDGLNERQIANQLRLTVTQLRSVVHDAKETQDGRGTG